MRTTTRFSFFFAGVLYALTSLGNGSEPKGISSSRPSTGPFIEVEGSFMVPYDEQIPGTEISFQMLPIPGGKVRLGSPADEPGRGEDEGPQVEVAISPMWVARCEVTWEQYHAYMDMYKHFKQFNQLRYQLSRKGAPGEKLSKQLAGQQAITDYLQLPGDVDAVTCPTPLYDSSFTYGPGEKPKQPAITMSHFAARQFTKWLSGITELGYRLPSEAEWEHFARAGTTTAYSFGNNPKALVDFAWFGDNSNEETHEVGTKLPNPWGLYDVHGNVMEWVLDQYSADTYTAFLSKSDEHLDFVNWPTEVEPRVLRGGSWQDESASLRSAARYQSADEDWCMSDPNLPISPWWFTEYEAAGVGMRIVRPLKTMDDETKQRVWEIDAKNIGFDVEDRLAEGRGTKGPARPELPAAIKQWKVMGEKLP